MLLSFPRSEMPSALRRALIAAVLLPTLSASDARADSGDPAPELTWESLSDRLAAEEEAGFSGSILVVRNSEVVLDQGYGTVDTDGKIPAAPRTIYAIGSTPIDFTRAGILLLAQEGKLGIDDPVSKYFPETPADKRAMTIWHLVSGSSGLRDFHDLPGDRDPDHHWIDRDTAVARILAQELLFEPGVGREHSHSAWGLLAAVIEIVSGQTYPDFLRARFFGPLGMDDTGFFGDHLPRERMAIGFGERSDGEVNAPPYWGPTSWLVMGSGGQVSTTHDLWTWNRAMRSGQVLRGEWLDLYWSPPGSLLAGGDMYGFEVTYTEGPGTLFFAMTNRGTRERRDAWQELSRDLHALVVAETMPPFTLGVQLMPSPEGAHVMEVAAGSAAEAAGVRSGDVLLSVNGRAMGRAPLAVLEPYLRSGEELSFQLNRGGDAMTLEVVPRRRGAQRP